MALRNSVVPAALAFAGCLPGKSDPPPAFEQLTYQTPLQGGECEVEAVTYHVRGELAEDERATKSIAPDGALLVSVGESSSVIDCGEDLVRVAMPGAELTAESFASNSRTFALDVPAVVIGGHRPSIRVAALLDVNDNGECDPGELTASADLEASELEHLTLQLRDERCPERE